MLSLVGNSASSGSTLLADLLDSSDYSACGPELNFFSNRYLYDFSFFKTHSDKLSDIYKIGVTGLFPAFHRLEKYGLQQDEFQHLIKTSDTFQAFAERFSHRFIAFRRKSNNGIAIEKTPQNLNSIDQFLAAYPEGYFIYLLRNPLYVYNSMRKRGFGEFQSLFNWLLDVAKFAPYKNHPRVIILHYEALVERPYTLAADTLNTIANESLVSPQHIQAQYAKNTYRQSSSQKLQSWSINDYGNISNANKQKVPLKRKKAFKSALDARISQRYAARYNLLPLSYREALNLTGYGQRVYDLLSNVSGKKTLRKSYTDQKKFLAKWLRQTKEGNTALKDINIYLNPIAWS